MCFIDLVLFFTCRELKLQREHDYYTNKLHDRQKKFQAELDIVAKQLRDFSSKDRMSEAETYMRELTEITEKLEQFQEEVWTQSSHFQTLCLGSIGMDNDIGESFYNETVEHFSIFPIRENSWVKKIGETQHGYVTRGDW